MDGTELHILNGDQALELWKQCGFRGESLVWRETYLKGPLPDTDDLDVFRNARAEYLSRFDELAGIGSARLYRHLLKMDEVLLRNGFLIRSGSDYDLPGIDLRQDRTKTCNDKGEMTRC